MPLQSPHHVHRIQPPLQPRPRPHHARPAPLGHLQLRRALDIDVGQYPDLHAGGQPDPGRHELEAGGVHGIPGQHDRAGAHAAELAPGRPLRRAVPGAGACLVRSVGRKRRRRSARAGGLRMVRNSDLGRRGSREQPAGDSVSRMGTRRAPNGNLLPGVLAYQPGSDPERHRVHPLPAGHQRAGSAGGRTAAAGLGLQNGRRIRSHAVGAVALHELSGLS